MGRADVRRLRQSAERADRHRRDRDSGKNHSGLVRQAGREGLSKPPFSADSLLLCDGQPTFIEFKRWRIADEKIVPIDRWLEENLKNKALDTALLYRRALAARAAFAGKPVRLWFVISDNSKLQQMHALRRKAGLTAGLPLDFLNRFGDPDRYGNRLYFDEVRMFTAEEFAALVREQHRWTVPT